MENLDLLKQFFLIKPVKGNKKKKNVFSPQSEPHTTKLCLSVVLKHFGEIHRELFFLDKLLTISETRTEILRKFFFLPCLNGKILRKIWIGLNNCF